MRNNGQIDVLRVLDDFVCEALPGSDVPQGDDQHQGLNEGMRVIEELLTNGSAEPNADGIDKGELRANHDEYGKRVLRQAVGCAFQDRGPSVVIDYAVGHGARIDGTIANMIAVEVESRVSKQVRGAVLDLICHTYPKKLLVLLPVHMKHPSIAAEQCRHIFRRFVVSPADFRVVLLCGYGGKEQLAQDIQLVQQAVAELGGPTMASGGPETGHMASDTGVSQA